MDWITGMQKAIDYIEANLTEEIDYEKVAAEWLTNNEYKIIYAPELAVYHWGIVGGYPERTIEIWIPIEKK